MFYSQFILAKKGPLGTIWIAAHLERKLRKNQVADTDIGVSVDSILFPEMPIALRLSSHLLLGVVRIYSRKVNYLFDDCSEALLKVKQAFRSATVDLLPEESTAPYHSITLPETFDLDDFELPDSEIFQGNYVDRHISSKDQITLQDTMEGVVYSTSKFGLDERFDDDDASGFDLDEELMVEKAVTAEHATGTSNSNVDPHTSVQDIASFKYDDNQDDLNVPVATPAIGNENQHLEEYDGDNEPIDYAQAPSTPGLWEEPNLSNIQETSAFEDHIEPENHAITESAVKENLENSSHEQPYNLFDSHEKSPSHVTTTEPVLTNNLGSTPLTESLVAEQHHNQFESHEKFLPHLTSEQTLTNPFSTPFKESLVVDHQESEPVIAVSVDPAKLEDLLNKNVSDKAPAVQTVDYTHDSIASSGFSSLRPCVTLLNHETNRERPHATEAFDMNFPQIHLPELGPNNEVQVTSNISTSDFPAPEKLLSLPQGIPDVPMYMVPESTPTPQHIPTVYEGDVGTDTISGKKRSFTESSLTAQSLDLNQSSGFFTITTNATEKSIVNDDDLLSSILVGRKSSILKMKPTPPPQSTKRRRSTPKTGILKRKVVMDDNMVLHGDTIRQQLINTEDIHRLRKKAPCSQFEISLIAKQLWEDELFYEPIFTGVSLKLASLHNKLYDLSTFAVTHRDASLEGGKDPESISHNDESNMQLETRTQNLDISAKINVSKEFEDLDNFEPVTRKDVPEEQPIEFPLVTDNRTFDNNTTTGSQTQLHATEDLTKPFRSEHDLLGQGTAMEIDPKISDAVMPVEVESLESLTHANLVANDTCVISKAGGDVHSNDKMDLQYADVDPIETSVVSENNNISIESSIASEIKNDVPSIDEISEHKHVQDNEIRENEEQVVKEDEALALNARSNAQNLIYDGIFGEDIVAVEPHDGEVNLVTEGVSLDERENPGHQVTRDTTAMNLEDIPADNRVDDHEITQPAVEHNTDFLNFDDMDDDDANTGGDYAPDAEVTRVIENTGWSSRTKAVAKYLQIIFDKEGARGRNMIPVNNLLTGKTRKEASRMFFETLVLKTKDYIHVEQAEPFENINVFPRAKLLKSDF